MLTGIRNFLATLKVKKLWKTGNFPMVSDWIIKKKLKDLKDSYQGAVHKKGKTKEVEKAAYSGSLQTVTFNITSPARREEVEADIILTEVGKKENIEVLLDHIEPGRPGASR